MKFLPPPSITTHDWAPIVFQHDLPDRTGVSLADFGTCGKRWSQDPALRPWFDQPDALDTIARWRDRELLSSNEEQLLLQWVEHGYFVIESAIDSNRSALLDRYRHDLDNVWTADEPLDGLQVSGVRIDGVKRNPVSHAELLSWPLDLRLRLRDTQTWRIHYYQPYTRAGLELAKAPTLLRMQYLLLQHDPLLLNLTGYKYSSEVALHQDLWFYHLQPPVLAGVWLPCQDVHEDNGPLAVYPSSHRQPVWPGFSNYPQTNYRTCHTQMHADIELHLREQVEGLQRAVLPVNRGDAIFLHGLLAHEPEKVTDRRDNSRFSLVLHYSVRGANRVDQVQGPFNY
ncbi:MAG: phytanoyl-CoA dioxygenase family protein [Myxococcales bacterium]|nr:phytanoyl-CoA dioxygenase family protein [Myxococcales bacterium]